MRKSILITGVAVAAALSGCSPTPADLANESRLLHVELAEAVTSEDSAAVFRQIAELESRARQIFDKAELKEYERLAHSQEDL